MLQMGAFLTRPLVSGYAVSLGASVPVAGFLAGLLATSALVIRPISGVVSDYASKKVLLVASSALFCMGAFGCALFRSVPALGICLALQGFAFAFKSTIVVSLVPLIVPHARVGAAVGWMGLAYTAAVAVGPAVGSEVKATWGYAVSFAASGALLAGALVLALQFRVPGGEGDGIRGSMPGCARQRFSLRTYFYLPAAPLALVAGMLMVAQGTTSSFILLASELRGVQAASLYFACYAMATLGARPLAGRASDAWGVRCVTLPMIAVAALGMLLLAAFDSVAGVVIGGICMGIGQGSAYASIQAESVRNVPEAMLGRSANTFFIGPDLGMGLGPIAGGAVLQTWGPSAMFFFNAAMALAALALFEAIYHK